MKFFYKSKAKASGPFPNILVCICLPNSCNFVMSIFKIEHLCKNNYIMFNGIPLKDIFVFNIFN